MIIGMLGGSFCPPTKAHIELSRKCIDQGLCDKVVWVPVNEAYRKSTNISAKHRIEMVKLALQNEPNIDYSLHEQDFNRIVRTFESIQILQRQYPNDKIVFIAGADKLTMRWMQQEEFLRNFGYIVTSRGDINCSEIIQNSTVLSKYKDNIQILEYDSDISSTQVREDIQSVGTSDLVSEKVLRYITKNELFMS